jgi:plasmid maintenance system antidote protein VapI
MVRNPTHRAPTHPGEMRLDEFQKPMAFSPTELAKRLVVEYPRVNELAQITPLKRAG